MENRGKRQSASIFGGMGFYIALLVCVVAAGVVGYFALLSPSEDSTYPLAGASQPPRQAEITAPVSAGEEEPASPVVSDQPLELEQAAPVLSEEAPPREQQSLVVVSSHNPPAATPPAVRIVAPLEGETVAVFSVSQLVYDETLGDWRTHDGLDIRAEEGTEVVAAAAGTVRSVAEDPQLGTTVVIDHEDGYVTSYACLQAGARVLAGDSVEAGTVIGAVGSTAISEAALGAHLHFTVEKDGEAVDPEEFLKQ